MIKILLIVSWIMSAFSASIDEKNLFLENAIKLIRTDSIDELRTFLGSIQFDINELVFESEIGLQYNLLHIVVRNLNLSRQAGVIIHILAEVGADINSKDSKGNTSLMMAIMRKNKAAVQWLLEHGADIFATNESGRSALHCMFRVNCHLPIMEIVFPYAIQQFSLLSPEGKVKVMTILNSHCIGHQPVLSQMFVTKLPLSLIFEYSKGLPLMWSVKDQKHSGILILAIENCYDIEDIRIILKNPYVLETINHIDKKFKTALLCALQRGDLGIVDLLLKSGSNGNLISGFWETALQFAVTNYAEKPLFQLLLRHELDLKLTSFRAQGNVLRLAMDLCRSRPLGYLQYWEKFLLFRSYWKYTLPNDILNMIKELVLKLL